MIWSELKQGNSVVCRHLAIDRSQPILIYGHPAVKNRHLKRGIGYTDFLVAGRVM
jgi:hypothetical protein